MGMLANRLNKNATHLKKWAKRENISCYRLYQNDIPEYPLTIDWYDGRVAAWANQRKRDETPELRQAFLQEAFEEIASGLRLDPGDADIFIKDRRPGGQYAPIAAERTEFLVQESGLKFRVNLSDYHDTGLFLDHRVTRQLVAGQCAHKKMLNLFCYTGSFSLYAARAGARETVSVDLSKRYLNWTQDNFTLNGLDDRARHFFVRDDVFAWLPDADEKGHRFDVIVCDPPTFSNSKRMEGMLDIQRDHVRLIEMALKLLTPGGLLYFSTNKRGFTLNVPALEQVSCRDITVETTPQDFAGSQPHSCYLFKVG